MDLPHHTREAIESFKQFIEDANITHHGAAPTLVCYGDNDEPILLAMVRPIDNGTDGDFERAFGEVLMLVSVAKAGTAVLFFDTYLSDADRGRSRRIEALTATYVTKGSTDAIFRSYPYAKDNEGKIYWLKVPPLEERTTSMLKFFATLATGAINLAEESPFSLSQACDYLNDLGHRVLVRK